MPPAGVQYVGGAIRMPHTPDANAGANGGRPLQPRNAADQL
jgi:hypothetical protein